MTPGPAITTRRAAEALVRRAHRELDEACGSSDVAMRFLHAHMAAIRAASAVLTMAGSPGLRRGRPVNVWDELAQEGSSWQQWSVQFAAGAPVRAAIEAGRLVDLDPAVADGALEAAHRFVDRVASSIAEPDVAEAGVAEPDTVLLAS